MKKVAIIITALFMSFFMNAQNTTEKSLGDFYTVKVYDLIYLKMIKSNTNKVVISGVNKDDVEIVNKNGKLKIKMNIQESFNGSDTVVVLYYTSVDVIDANEGAKVEVKDVIKQYEIDLKTQEGSEITAKLDTSYTNIRAVSGGIINIAGTSKNQNISINTGGIVNASDFVTKRTEVSINAAGEAFINAKDMAKIKIKAGGDVYVYGNPKELKEERILGGRVKRM